MAAPPHPAGARPGPTYLGLIRHSARLDSLDREEQARAVGMLEKMHASAAKLRREETGKMAAARTAVLAHADATCDEKPLESCRMWLLCRAGLEANFWFEYLVGSLLSSRAADDLHQINPVAPLDRWEAVLNDVATLLLRSTRISQLSRLMIPLRDASSLLQKVIRQSGKQSADTRVLKEWLMEVSLKLEEVGRELSPQAPPPPQ